MDFEQAYAAFLAFHASRRRGERRRRFKEGHGHAEGMFLRQVWWPAFRNFRDLHPEFEVTDFRDGYRYLDFAFIRDGTRLAIEIDGYGPHVARPDRRQFADQLQRQNQLVVDGWAVLRFAFDDVRERPRRCQQVIQQFMGRWLAGGEMQGLSFQERAVIQFARAAGRPLRPKDVCSHLDVGRPRAYALLKGLLKQGWFVAAGGRQRIRSYALDPRRELGLLAARPDGAGTRVREERIPF